MRKIAYLTVKFPFGKGETQFLPEIKEMVKAGYSVSLFPVRPDKGIFHQNAKELAVMTTYSRILDRKVIKTFILRLFKHPIISLKLITQVILSSKNMGIILKNLLVIPKGFYASQVFVKEGIDHIHAHWGSTPSTMAYIASSLSGIPWSMTLHRWDIKENNLLKKKVESAVFVRCISEHGKRELFEIIGESQAEKVKVMHLGVEFNFAVPTASVTKKNLIIATPANLLPVKGHKYLIDACHILLKRGIKNFRCHFFGEGPLREELNRFITEKGLNGFVKILGEISNDKLLELYRQREIDLVMLPSVNTEDGQHEGIPVSLMEAMAYQIPVVSTNTGGIPELIKDGAGILVEEKNPEAIASAMEALIREPKIREGAALNGKKRLMEKFDVTKNVKELLAHMNSNA